VDDATLESSAVGDSIAASVAPSFYDDGHSSASEASEEKDLASALNDATLESSVLSDSTAASISRSFDDGDNHSSAIVKIKRNELLLVPRTMNSRRIHLSHWNLRIERILPPLFLARLMMTIIIAVLVKIKRNEHLLVPPTMNSRRIHL
jgi:hypothetical protein